jgi:F0F1-type ATP synthase assembly protein I
MAGRTNPPNLLRYSTVGIEFIAAFGIGVAVGAYADYRTGGGRTWTLVGAAVGFAAGLYRLISVARQYRRDLERKDEQ